MHLDLISQGEIKVNLYSPIIPIDTSLLNPYTRVIDPQFSPLLAKPEPVLGSLSSAKF